MIFYPKSLKDIDDTFCNVPFLITFKQYCEFMNTKYQNIKFNSKFEKNNFFSFLDVKITGSNNKSVTSVFRKATFSGVFANH